MNINNTIWVKLLKMNALWRWVVKHQKLLNCEL